MNQHRTEEFCNSLIPEGLKIDWACITRPDLVDVSLLRLLKRAACRSVTFGVESASPRILELIRKGHTVEDTNRALAACQEVGMTFNAYYMIGLPDETEDEIEMAVEHMRQSGANYVSLNTFTPYPGSALFEKVMEMGLLEEPPDWGRYGRHSRDNHFAVMIPKERFQRIVDRTYLEVDKINGTLLKKFKRYAERSKMRLRRFIASPKIASRSL